MKNIFFFNFIFIKGIKMCRYHEPCDAHLENIPVPYIKGTNTLVKKNTLVIHKIK